jgi:hypothetical protein
VTPRDLLSSEALGRFSDDEEDDCDEDLSKAQRMEWKAKQEDLNNMRKGKIMLCCAVCACAVLCCHLLCSVLCCDVL